MNQPEFATTSLKRRFREVLRQVANNAKEFKWGCRCSFILSLIFSRDKHLKGALLSETWNGSTLKKAKKRQWKPQHANLEKEQKQNSSCSFKQLHFICSPLLTQIHCVIIMAFMYAQRGIQYLLVKAEDLLTGERYLSLCSG